MTVDQERPGSFWLGLSLSLGVYLVAIAVIVGAASTGHMTSGFQAAALVSILASGAVSVSQSRRGRTRTAAGAALGTLLWPALFLGLLLWAISQAISRGPIFIF
jgi:hypothetical protein